MTEATGPVSPQIGIVVGIAAEAKAAHRLSANILCSGGRPDIAALQAHGLTVQTDQGEDSGLHAVVRTAGGYIGAADPRREGEPQGY